MRIITKKPLPDHWDRLRLEITEERVLKGRHLDASGQVAILQQVDCPHCQSTLEIDDTACNFEQINMAGGGLVNIVDCLACGFKFGFYP